MIDFSFYNPTRICFGKNIHAHVGQHTAQYSQNILLHYGGQSIRKTGVYDTVIQSLKAAGVRYTELGGVQPNPRLSLVQEGIALCREQKINFILAVGGGSVIDSAKAIASGVAYDGNVWDFFHSDKRPQTILPIGVVLTIPAAGSESSDGTVITNEEGPFKRSFTSDLLFPRFALLNPELCYTLSSTQSATGGADIYAHILERYFSPNSNTDLTDRLCEGAMQTVQNYLPVVLQKPQDYDAWAEVMWVGTVAHNTLLGKGRMEDWSSHMIEHELSALYNIAHGAGLAIVFPAWMKYVYKQHIEKFVQYAVRVMGVALSLNNPEEVALEGIRRTEQFFSALGLCTRLSEANIPCDQFRLMAEKACVNGKLGSFMPLGVEDVINIFELAK